MVPRRGGSVLCTRGAGHGWLSLEVERRARAATRERGESIARKPLGGLCAILRGGSRAGLVRDDGRHALAAVLLCLDGALADDEGDREEESGRAKAEADDEPGGAAFDVVLAALVSFCFRRDAVDDERVRAVTTLQKNHQRRDHGDGFRMDAGDADFGVVPVAFLDGERVVAFAALRVREAST